MVQITTLKLADAKRSISEPLEAGEEKPYLLSTSLEARFFQAIAAIFRRTLAARSSLVIKRSSIIAV